MKLIIAIPNKDLSKMDCELVLRSDLFDSYETITKPSEERLSHFKNKLFNHNF